METRTINLKADSSGTLIDVDTINLKTDSSGTLIDVDTITESLPETISKDLQNFTISSEPIEKVKSPKPSKNPIYYDTLILSGGSSKGLMTLGAVQYAYDNYLLKDMKNFIGTSSGSMICYLLAIGYTPIEIIVYICTNQLMEKIQHLNIVAMIQGRGASSYSNIQEQLEKMSIAKIGYLPTLNDLKEKCGKTLICVTHNLTENRTEYLSWKTHPHLPCITAIRMSANLPLVFETYRYGNNLYVDGGISDNFAIDIGEELGEKVLGILLESNDNSISYETDIGTIEFIYKLIFVPIQQATEWKIKNKKETTHIIRIGHETKVKFFEFNVSSKSKLEMFSIGYEKMQKEFE